MAQLRVGVIGCGFIATEAHLPALSSIADLSIAAIADLSPQRLAAYGARAAVDDVDRYADYRRVLDRPDIDLVIVSVPPGAHCEVATAAVSAGKHVICEKPIATTLRDATAMLAAARSHRVKLAVFNNFLFFPETQLVGAVVRSGAIGAIKVAWINALGLGMDVANFLTYQGGTAAWKYESAMAGGGVLIDYGPHAAYLLEYYFAQEAVRINAVVNRFGAAALSVEDYAFCRLEFPSGYGMMQLAWHPTMQSDARVLQTGGVTIVGETGLIEFVYRGRGEGPHTAVEKVIVRTAHEESVHLIPFAETTTKLARSFRSVLADFVESIREDREPVSSAAIGKRSLEIILASYASAASGTTVDLPLNEASPVYAGGIRGLPDFPVPAVVGDSRAS